MTVNEILANIVDFLNGLTCEVMNVQPLLEAHLRVMLTSNIISDYQTYPTRKENGYYHIKFDFKTMYRQVVSRTAMFRDLTPKESAAAAYDRAMGVLGKRPI